MVSKDLVIVGAGGFGREVLWQLSRINERNIEYDILGFIDDAPALQGQLINSYPVIGDIPWLKSYPKEVCAVIAIGNPSARRDVYNKIKVNSSIRFPTIVAEDVKCSDSVKFGQGCIICLSCIVTVNVSIGDFVIVNLDCTIGHDAVIDDFVTLYPSVNVSGNVHIGACTEVGTGVNMLQEVEVGSNVIIGAGSVVVDNVPSNCTAVGVPARRIK